MRAIVFGSHTDPRMAAAKAELEAKGLQSVYRNPAFFKPAEVEKAQLVVVGEEALHLEAIRKAYEAINAEVQVLPAPKNMVQLHITVDSPGIKETFEEARTRLESMKAELDKAQAAYSDLMNTTDLMRAEKDARIAELEALLGQATEPTAPIDKPALVEKAVALGIGNKSTLERWGVDRLTDEIAKAERK